MRNDPNNIFAALTSRMGALELNQSLLNNWLTLWQNKINTRFKQLNATHDELKLKVRSVQANVSGAVATLGDLKLRLDEDGPGELGEKRREAQAHMLRGLEELGEGVRTLREQLNATQQREQRLRVEVDRMRINHRIELMACMCLSLALSSLLAVHCVQRRQRRIATRPRRLRHTLSSSSSRGRGSLRGGWDSESRASSESREQTPLLSGLSGMSAAGDESREDSPLMTAARSPSAGPTLAAGQCRPSPRATAARAGLPTASGLGGGSGSKSVVAAGPADRPGAPSATAPVGPDAARTMLPMVSSAGRQPSSFALPDTAISSVVATKGSGRKPGSRRTHRPVPGENDSATANGEGSSPLSRRSRGGRASVPSSRSMPLLGALLRGEGWAGARGHAASFSDADDDTTDSEVDEDASTTDDE